MMKKFTKVISAVLALTMVLSTGAVSAFAAATNPTTGNPYVNSVGSVAADITNDSKVGQDSTQEKQSAYETFEYTTDTTKKCEVYATVAEGSDVYDPTNPDDTDHDGFVDGKIVVGLPTVLILDGTPDESGYYIGSGTYEAKGNIAGTTVINIVADNTFTMRQTGKADITASVTQDYTKFVVEGSTIAGQSGVNNHVTPSFNNNAKGLVTVKTNGAEVNGHMAGSWFGEFAWTISLTNVA